MKLNINSEHARLKKVIIGSPKTFIEGERINESMRKYYGTLDAPKREIIAREYNVLEKILKKYGVQVARPKPLTNVPQQLTPRDIGFVVGNTFVVCSMKYNSRKNEIKAILPFIEKFKCQIINAPDGIILEGGNIIIDNDKILMGIGERTNKKAASWLNKQFGKKYQIIPIKLGNSEEIIHLDAVFNPIGGGYALVYKHGVINGLKQLADYKKIWVNKAEKGRGACNVLSINEKTLVMRDGLPRLKKVLELLDFNIHQIAWDESSKPGVVGPRCATLPLVRDISS